MLSRVTGNPRVKESLRRMLTLQRLPGALLFVGEEGVGKKLVALELAKSLNCRSRVDQVEACDRCAACKRITESTFPPYSTADENKQRMFWSRHADIALVRPYNRTIRIDPMRELDREANFRPSEGNARVFIIDDADRMNDHASNALLKTLEEPPSTSHLILITSRPASLLPTIRSRCQTIRFVPLSAPEIEEQLLSADKELSRSDAHLLAHAARGSIGRALSMDLPKYLEQRESMLEIVDTLALSGDRARLLRAAEELCDAKRKDEYEPRLNVLETLAHDVWNLSLNGSAEGIANVDLSDRLRELGQRVDSIRAAHWLSEIDKHRRKFDVNINKKVATDALFLAMAEEP